MAFYLVGDGTVKRIKKADIGSVSLAEFRANVLEIRMFYVGAGEVILITRNNGDTAILVDGGAANGKTNKTRSRPFAGLLKQNSLRAIVASHPHNDHSNFHVTLAAEFPAVFSNDAKYFDNATADANVKFAEIQAEHKREAERQGVVEGPLPFVRERVTDDENVDGDERIDDFGGDGEVNVHMVKLDRVGTKEKEKSIFMWLFYREARFLFTGDVDEDYELEILSRVKAVSDRAHFLKLTHHGNEDGNTTELINDLRPGIAVASTHVDAQRGHILDRAVRTRLGNAVIRETHDESSDKRRDVIVRTDGFIRQFGPLVGILFQVFVQAPPKLKS